MRGCTHASQSIKAEENGQLRSPSVIPYAETCKKLDSEPAGTCMQKRAGTREDDLRTCSVFESGAGRMSGSRSNVMC